MDVVGARELDPTAEGGAEAALLEQDRGHGEAEEGEPGERREDEGRRERRHRREDEDAGREGEPKRPGPPAGDKGAGGDVGSGDEDRPRSDEEQEPLDPVERSERDGEDRGRDPERERRPEAAAVEAHPSATSCPTVRVSGGSGGGSSLRELRPDCAVRVMAARYPTSEDGSSWPLGTWLRQPVLGGCGRLCDGGSLESELAVACFREDRVALAEAALEERRRERVLD